MAESKFDRIFQKAPPAAEPDKRPERVGKEAPIARPQGVGRPPGKRSDPAWKQFSVLLKKDTQREAANILRANDEGKDLSGLVQNLLENWIKRQK
jgi:hypothetical protein